MADLKPIYKRVNGEWVKQTAFQRTNGEWVKISEANEPTYTVSGVWEFYDDVYLDYGSIDREATVNFTSNGTKFTKMTAKMGDGLYYNNIRVFNPAGDVWTNNAYKTVDFGLTPQTISEEFYEGWFKFEAKRKEITFYFYNGSSTKTLTAYEGMTWEEYIDSDFNSEGKFGGSSYLIYYTSTGGYYVTSSGTTVKVTRYIQAGVTYRKGEKLPPAPSVEGGNGSQ